MIQEAVFRNLILVEAMHFVAFLFSHSCIAIDADSVFKPEEGGEICRLKERKRRK